MGCLHPKKDTDDVITIKKSQVFTADQWREQGNNFFKANDYVLASKAYSQAIVLPTQNLNPQVSIFYSNRARCYLYLRDFPSAAADALTALQIDTLNVKAYLLCAQAKGYIAAQGNDSLVSEALEYCRTALAKCKERSWTDGVEKAKLLRTKLLVLRSNSVRKQQQAELTAVLDYYRGLHQDLSSALSTLVPKEEAVTVPDYFTCLISLVVSS